MKRFISAAAVPAAFCAFTITVLAGGYSLFGEATELGNGEIQMVSDAANDMPYGGMVFSIPSGLTFADLHTLSTEYNVTDDDCGGGSPRFGISLDLDHNGTHDGWIFAYVGPEPNYVGCTQNTWEDSGNLLDGSRYLDAGQLPGGTFYNTYANALANYGTADVLDVILVIDSSWKFADKEQTILFRNLVVNDPVVNEPETKDDCKNGGWESYGFKNQGQCVSSIVSNRK